MQFYKCALFCAVLACLLLDPITARKGFGGGGSRHSYPKSGGLSGGGGGHGYPSSGGFSGGGHGYPSSGGSHGYPSSGGSHAYPSSGGSHGYPSSGSNSHGYPSGGLSGNSPPRPAGGSHAYPSSGGSHGYPASGGLSGNSNRGTAGSTTNVHHHYHYNPPQSIAYTTNGRRVEYPVYHGTPPTYVYKYKDSGSKYGTLLTGLALLNLGALGATAYAFSQSGSHGNSGSYGSGGYKAQPGEVCKFGLKTKTSVEETRIDCNLILNFILAEQGKISSPTAPQNRTTITTSTTVTNVTIVNNTEPVVETTTQKVLYEQLPNGTFVAVTSIPVNVTEPPAVSNASNPMQQSVVTTTTTNTTTVVDALDVKGAPVQVTPDMVCYVIRTTPTTHMRKEVPCQLLQTYADKSIQRNAASRSFPTFAVLTAVLAVFLVN
ncbi:hyphally regulated cell wall protein 1-like [Phthorimaea operculella]|nr:hyphally regulated cell wall protein 1-like [Phthorimaea operculella]